MTSLLGISLAILAPLMIGIYALAFIAGGIYYLEQRVARIRDQFPAQAPLARLMGIAALLIGLLAAFSAVGYLLWGPASIVGAVVAAGSGIAFAICHLYTDLTPLDRIRDLFLAVVCLGLVFLLVSWIQTSLG